MGKVSELVIDPKEGRITEAVVSFGGFMGLGEKSVAVPWNELTMSPTTRAFTLAMGKEELESAPDWKKTRPGASSGNSASAASPSRRRGSTGITATTVPVRQIRYPTASFTVCA
jgi:hypothetical protein